MRGTLPLKLRLPGCEPIRRLSGTHDPKMRVKLVRMLHTLHEQGRDDIVNAVAKGSLKPLQVYNLFRFNRLEDLPHADELPLYADTWPAWIDGLECSDVHRHSCRKFCERIAGLLPADARLADARAALLRFRDLHRDHPRTFALAKNTIAAMIRSVLGKRHRLYLEVRDIPDVKGGVKRLKHPLTPDGLQVLVKLLPEPYNRMVWTMATTGMGWREYTGPWEREGEGLRIHGTKAKGRDRLIPYVGPVYPAERHEQRVRGVLNKHGLMIYDLRRTFAGLMVEAGIPRPRRKAYLGHTSDDMTSLYEAQEVREYLVKDAARLRNILGEPEGGPLLRVMRV